MRHTAKVIAFLAGFLPAAAVAQVANYPQTLPANTVVGRLGVSAGPSQAIPISSLPGFAFADQSANRVFAGPSSGSAVIPAFRALVGADLPVPGASSLGGVKSSTCSSHNWFNTLDTSGALGCAQPAFSDLSGSVTSAMLNADVYSTAHSWSGVQTFTNPIVGTTAFTQTGTSAASTTIDALYRGKVYTPEMFSASAISAALGTAAASVPDATSAIQAAINALCAIGGGTVQLGPGAYGVTGVNITCNNLFIRGQGKNATTLVHKPSAPSSALFFSAGASILSNTGVTDLAIGSGDTVFNKIAINASDVSFFTVRNVNVAHYPVDGTLYRGSGGSGTALFTQGREHGTIENFESYAEQPIHISVNPNSTISMDSWVFRNLVLVGNLASLPGSFHLITIDTAVNLFNTAFDGHQNWIGGTDGLHWVDTTSTQASLGLYISGVKAEQSETSGASGYVIDIQHNTALDALKIDGIVGGDRALVKLRKVNTTRLSNCYFDPGSGVGTNTVGLDLDSTDLLASVRNCFWTNVGGRATTASISGLNTAQADAIISGGSTAIPSNVIYTSSASPQLFNTIFPNSIIGVTTNSSAPAGSVGEYVESVIASGSAVALTTATSKTVTSISLTAGDWDVSSVAYILPAATTSVTLYASSISGTTNTTDNTPGKVAQTPTPAIVSGGPVFSSAIPPYRLSLAGTTTVFLIANANFTVSTASAYGIIRARRVR